MDSNYLAKQNIYLSEYIEDVFDLHLHSKIVYDLKKILLCARSLAVKKYVIMFTIFKVVK